MPLKIIIGGKEFLLDEQTQSTMEYFQQADSLQKINSNLPFELTTIDQNTWNELIKICKKFNNKFPEIAKIKTSDPKQVVGNQLAEVLDNKSSQQLNLLFRAAQQLKIKNLRRCIAAVVACKVYIKPTLDQYNNKRTKLGIKQKLTADQSRKMKELYTFMN